MLQAMGIGMTMQQRGHISIPCAGNRYQSVDVDEMLAFVGINHYGFWNHRGHARAVQGRRQAIRQLPQPLDDVTSLVLWLLELIMDTRLPPYEMDVTAGEEYATNDMVRNILYHAGAVRVVEFLGLKRKKHKFGRRTSGHAHVGRRGESTCTCIPVICLISLYSACT
jgi:hypothetical protein